MPGQVGSSGAAGQGSSSLPLRAAQYLRMSTEHQQYSTENQADAIAIYASQRNFLIIRTYTDEGKSGLNLAGRRGLRQLLTDVEGGKPDFSAVLVYDISRWGRFSDADEAAHYEYLCKRAGVIVHYCAEPFENDGSITADVVKGLKRVMSYEYSRELGKKVFTGHCRQVTLGRRQGSTPGFGLRRMLIDEHGSPKGILEHGQRKSIQTDRVILVPGPPAEVATVVRIHRMFIEEGARQARIADVLNREGTLAEFGHRWSSGSVSKILTSEKYAGHNVYNRVSTRLTEPRVRNPPEAWVRADNAFQAVVAPDTFTTTQAIIQARSRRLTDEELLERLAQLLRDKGTLSAIIIDEADDLPSSNVYRARFGGLHRAYQFVGFASPGHDARHHEINRALRELHARVVTQVTEAVRGLAGSTVVDQGNGRLLINDEFSVSIVICRCTRTGGGGLRWKVRLADARTDITIAVRMQDGNEEVLDYYLLPRLDLGTTQLRLGEENGTFLDAYRSDGLDRLSRLTARTDVRRVA